MIVIVDYGVGNLRSVQYRLKYLKYQAIISSKPEDILSSSALILPGVGSFSTGMKNLESCGLKTALNTAVLDNNIPILGICLGMQLFSGFSEEGNYRGLNWIQGKVKKFDNSIIGQTLRIPHVGWNTIRTVNNSPLTSHASPKDRFYFTHSYYMECKNISNVSAYTKYGVEFPSIVTKGNIMGTQFHPEKSHKYGIALIKSFLEYSLC